MSNLKKNLLYLQTAALLITTALDARVVAAQEIPFRGSLPGAESFEAQFPLLLVEGTGTGNIMHLGRVTATWERQGLLTDGSQTASYQFVASNGDRLFVESVGQADLTMAPDIHVLETGTITGGTGRFEGATGRLTIERVVVLSGPDTDTTSQSFDGTIVLGHKE